MESGKMDHGSGSGSRNAGTGCTGNGNVHNGNEHNEHTVPGRSHEKERAYVGLILAAGYSSRMGAFKPLLPIGNMTAVQRISDTYKKADVHKIIGVTGFLRERLVPVFESEGIIEAYNPDFEQGMLTSVKAGLRAAAFVSNHDTGPLQAPEGFFLMPVDCPLVPPEVIRQIAGKHREAPEAFIVPCFRGKKGHPLFIPAEYAEEILAYEGEGGLKAVTSRNEHRLIRLETCSEAVVLDMDTPEGYQEVLEYYERPAFAGDDSPSFSEELKGKRLFLVRHGEIRQHEGKIFLGQTDVPLSEKGRLQAAAAAEELLRQGIFTSRLYTSDLSRAAETAEIIRDKLYRKRLEEAREKKVPEMTVIREPKFREMNLGEWDGRFISEIREKYPEEYRKRGGELLTWKLGNDSENFYDLQYRVMKGFRSILKRELAEDPGTGGVRPKDIVIVSHSGVINVMVSCLQRKDLAEQIRNHVPNGGVVLIDYSD